MIVLLHGTGDDDTKSEQWMGWVAKTCRLYGETVLVVPGVGTSESAELKGRVEEIFRSVPSQGTLARRQAALALPDLGIKGTASLRTTLTNAGKEIKAIFDRYNGYNATTMLNQIFSSSSTGNSFSQGVTRNSEYIGSIKLRVAAAALAVLHYDASARVKKPIRIIGHSRGGSAALGLHNLLSVYGFDLKHTLLLDPVHGPRKPLGHKAYYSKVWRGKVVYITAPRKLVMANVPIVEASDGVATVIKAGHTASVKHGHMGKFQAFGKKEKDDRRAELGGILSTATSQSLVAGTTDPAVMKKHVISLFGQLTKMNADRKLIANCIINTLMGDPHTQEVF